jgi:homospermidine synthase
VAPARAPEKVLILGCGSVAQCTLPLLIRDLAIEPQRITIVDMIDNRARIADSITAGVSFEQAQVTPDNIDQFLSARVGDGDLLLDLAWNIDNPTILQWCRDHGVRYLNTSIEVWDPYDDLASTPPLARTLYVRHMDLRRMIAGWGDNKGATAVLEHGANPGLVSHFTKQALTEIATRVLQDGLASDVAALERALADEAYNHLSMLTGTKVIHISERDTQISNVPKEVDEFVNTWSVDGLYEEGIAPAELGWGTHERRLPPNAFQHHGFGPCNQICIARPGIETWVRSWVPSGEIRGMIIRHGEALTINDHLTVWGDDGNAAYRPTVHYAYCPTDSAVASVLELRMRNWRMQSRKRILNDEIIGGRDELGVLLMGHPYKSWWTGSLLSIGEARDVVAHQNATTVQVAGSIIATVTWMIEHPNEGIRVPDDLPWRDVLRVAEKYLGTQHSAAVDWDPMSTRNDLFPEFSTERDSIATDDPWQFANFLVD